MWSLRRSGVEGRFKTLEGGVGPGVSGFVPEVALRGDEVGKVHAAVAGSVGEVEEGLGGAVKIEHGFEAVARPLHRGETFFGCAV